MAKQYISYYRFFSALALCILYIAFTCQHPQFNFDDLYLVPQMGDKIRDDGLWSAIKNWFLALDLPTEYRTYSLARVLQVVLEPFFGQNPLPYYLFMACARLVMAVIAGDLIRTAQHSTVWTIEAFGTAVIVVISPFAMVRTFHHFAYLILPMIFILGMLWVAQRSRLPLLTTLPFAVLVPFLGEAAIPVLFTGILTIAWTRRRPIILVLIPLSVVLVAAHYWLLSHVASYSSNNRYGESSQSFISVNISFLKSIGTTILRGLWLPHTDKEPYQYGVLVTIDMWSHLDWQFAIALLVFSGLIFTLTKASPSAAIPARFLVGIVVICAATFSIYILLAQVTTLYSYPYGLQARYGYVPLTTSAITIFLLLRSTYLRTVALAIPGALFFVWLAIVAVQTPRQAAIDQQLLTEIADVSEKSPPVILVYHYHSMLCWPRSPGPQNPSVLSIDTPFQQDWTTKEVAKFVAPATLVWTSGFQLKGDEVHLIGSPGNVTVVPVEDSYVIGTTTVDRSYPYIFPLADLPIGPPKLKNSSEFRGTQFGSLAQLEGYYYVATRHGATLHLKWKALENINRNTSFAVHMLAKPGGAIIAQGDYVSGLLPIKDKQRFEETIMLSHAQLANIYYVGIGIDTAGTGNLLPVSNGLTDWDGHRLLIPVPQSLNRGCAF